MSKRLLKHLAVALAAAGCVTTFAENQNLHPVAVLSSSVESEASQDVKEDSKKDDSKKTSAETQDKKDDSKKDDSKKASAEAQDKKDDSKKNDSKKTSAEENQDKKDTSKKTALAVNDPEDKKSQEKAENKTEDSKKTSAQAEDKNDKENKENDSKKETSKPTQVDVYSEENSKYLTSEQKEILEQCKKAKEEGKSLTSEQKKQIESMIECVIKDKLGEKDYNEFKSLYNKKHECKKLTDEEADKLAKYEEVLGFEDKTTVGDVLKSFLR